MNEEQIDEERLTLWTFFDLLALEIARLKENECENSGLNWHDKYKELKDEGDGIS